MHCPFCTCGCHPVYKFLSVFASGSLCMCLCLHELMLDAGIVPSAPEGASCIYKFLSVFASGSHAYNCSAWVVGFIAMHLLHVECLWCASSWCHSFISQTDMHFSNLYRSLVASQLLWLHSKLHSNDLPRWPAANLDLALKLVTAVLEFVFKEPSQLNCDIWQVHACMHAKDSKKCFQEFHPGPYPFHQAQANLSSSISSWKVPSWLVALLGCADINIGLAHQVATCIHANSCLIRYGS